MLDLGNDNAVAVSPTRTRELQRLAGKGKGSGGEEEARERYQRQKLAPRRRRIYFASHLLKAAFDDLPFQFVNCLPEKQAWENELQMVGLIKTANKVILN